MVEAAWQPVHRLGEADVSKSSADGSAARAGCVDAEQLQFITGGDDLSLTDVNDATSIIYDAAGDDANLFFGAVIDPAFEGRIQVTVIATGIGASSAALDRPRAHSAPEPVSISAVNLDRPAYRRSEDAAPEPVKRVIRSFIDDDLETPTFLRKQMDAIQKELGEMSGEESESDELRKKVEEVGMPGGA